ncbi:MAG: Gldg family protein [Thermoanaerobaculia bacterium]|nr:Gldg family protein [Thermoanaerobaculia bacterium]
MSEGKTVSRLNLGLAILVGLGILGLVNWLGARHYQRFDWTSAGLYTLSGKSTRVLADLRKPVTVTVFMTEGSPLYAETQELLRRYQAASPLVSVETLNPERNPARAQAFLTEMGDIRLSVVFQAGEKKKVVPVDALAELDFERARMGGEPVLKAFKGEQEFTAAILTVTQEKSPKVVFTNGHGERPVAGRVREGLERLVDLLKQDNCTVEEWDSLADQKVPEGTDLVVVAGPRTGFTFPETDALSAYLAGGGRALLLLDPEFAPGPGNRMAELGLGPVFEAYGVRLGDDIVVDPRNALPLMGPETVVARSFRDHPVTKLLEGLPVVFPVVRSVGLAEPLPEGVAAQVLVETSPDGWGETNLADLETKVEKDERDVAGPVPLAVAVEAGEGRKARLVVVGDADFASSSGIANAANLYLVTSAVNWLLERESLISIPPKSTDQVAVTLSRTDIARLSIFVLLVLPAAAIGLGIAVWLKRRR